MERNQPYRIGRNLRGCNMEKQLILGFDIGGTKCAVITALWDGENIELLKKEKCATDTTIAPEKMIEKLINRHVHLFQILFC